MMQQNSTLKKKTRCTCCLWSKAPDTFRHKGHFCEENAFFFFKNLCKGHYSKSSGHLSFWCGLTPGRLSYCLTKWIFLLPPSYRLQDLPPAPTSCENAFHWSCSCVTVWSMPWLTTRPRRWRCRGWSRLTARYAPTSLTQQDSWVSTQIVFWFVCNRQSRFLNLS